MRFEDALGKKREKQMLKNVKKGETCENCEKM